MSAERKAHEERIANLLQKIYEMRVTIQHGKEAEKKLPELYEEYDEEIISFANEIKNERIGEA